MDLSIVIPAYNEEERLSRTLNDIETFFAHPREMSLREIIVVDDGSDDETLSVAEAWRDRLPLQVLRLPVNRGKGAALRLGVAAARGDVLLLDDADGATPIEEIEKLRPILEQKEADIVIGSRVLRTAEHPVRMRWHRRSIGRVYHAFYAPLIPGIADAACGFKLFRSDVAKDIFAKQTIDRFAYDIEIFSLAMRRGYRIREVPVQWTAVPGSKVRMLRDSWEMFWAVMGLHQARGGRKPAIGRTKIEN
ncbi:glycosyltransferase family 2 protein [Candidatus Peregrinibacteria bacterium]|nr:glycosyltransferase family 2 protein [Candidatus Peregrinibacteria bacterium]